VSTLLSLVERKLQSLPVAVQLTLPDGARVGDANAAVRFTVHDRASLARLAAGEVGVLGEDYVEGRIDIDGTMRDVMTVATALLPSSPVDAARGGWLTGLVRRLRSVWHHSIERDARQIEFHYDLSDDFYALWLDPRRVYSCAYYRDANATLGEAQEAKLDHICRKLRLTETDRFLDVGAGWGGLLLWAAEHYGVTATGITLSRNQHAYVNRLIAEKGLGGRVRMELLDYRKLAEGRNRDHPYDKIASVGMFEHVGRARLQEYFARLRQLLRPGGLLLNHGITAGGVYNDQLGAGMGEFIEKYIFPGGELTHVSRVLEGLSGGGLEALDVENLRPHYARTLWSWSDALEARLIDARAALVSSATNPAADPGEAERALRAYRLYLAGSAMAFEHGWIALHQVLAQRVLPGCAGAELDSPAQQSYPWRRDYMYGKG